MSRIGNSLISKVKYYVKIWPDDYSIVYLSHQAYEEFWSTQRLWVSSNKENDRSLSEAFSSIQKKLCWFTTVRYMEKAINKKQTGKQNYSNIRKQSYCSIY